MSLIYKSLRQLQDKQAEKASETKATRAQVISKDFKPLILRGAVFALVLALVLGAMLWALQLRVEERFPIYNRPEIQDIVAEETRPQTQATPQEATNTIDSTDLTTKPSIKEPPRPRAASAEEMAKPTQALQAHFASQAVRNESVITLERDLTQAMRLDDIQRAQMLILRLQERLGAHSLLVLKWQGVLFLKTDRPDQAEKSFLQVLAKAPQDVETRVNFIQSLVAQGKQDQAGRELKSLTNDAPLDPRVQRLQTLLALIKQEQA
jgi:predicted Zn-dependent protease